MGSRTAFHKPFFILWRSVSILSKDTARLTVVSIAAILFVELLDVIQVEMNLVIAAVVRVLPLVVRPVVREVNRSDILFE